MALLSSSTLLLLLPTSTKTPNSFSSISKATTTNQSHLTLMLFSKSTTTTRFLVRARLHSILTCQLCTHKTQTFDKSSLHVSEAFSEHELWAAACLRVRSFYHPKQDTFRIQDHKRYLTEREFEALKERISGKRIGFRKVSCINATIPLSEVSNSLDDLCSVCKYSDNGEDRVVIGTLDLNQCLRLPDEITGKRPEGVGSDFARAYLSNVCVAKELLRNGLAFSLVAKSKKLATEWGITDLYVHVAVDNEPAKKLYMKSGFIYENDEPAWQARFLDRPRRILLWTDVSGTSGVRRL